MKWTGLLVAVALAFVCTWGISQLGPATAGIPIQPRYEEAPPEPVTTGLGKKIAGVYFGVGEFFRNGCNFPCDPDDIPPGADVCSAGLEDENGIPYGCCCGGPDIEPGDADFCTQCYDQSFGTSEVIWEIHADGTLIESTSADMGDGILLAYSNVHGNWRKIGKDTIEAVTMGFGWDVGLFGLPFGTHFSTPVNELIMTFSKDRDTVTVEGTSYVFSPGQDPTDPDLDYPLYPTFRFDPFECRRLPFR